MERKRAGKLPVLRLNLSKVYLSFMSSNRCLIVPHTSRFYHRNDRVSLKIVK